MFTVKEERLNGLTAVSIRKNIHLNAEHEIIQVFVRKSTRTTKLFVTDQYDIYLFSSKRFNNADRTGFIEFYINSFVFNHHKY